MTKRKGHANNRRPVASCCLIAVGMLAAAGVDPAFATLSEDEWQSLEQWEREKPADVAVAPATNPPEARLLPSLDMAPSVPAAAATAAAGEHKIDFAGLPPLFERATPASAKPNRQDHDKAASAKPPPVLLDPIAEVGRHNERRGMALTLPGAEKAPADTAATAACTKPKAPVIDPRLASDRATLAALQNAVKSVGAEQAFDFMLPPAKSKTASAPQPATAMPELTPLTLPPLP